MDPCEKNRYLRVPKSFLEGVFLQPHNFNLPEKPIHGVIVNRQLREDLFDTVFKKIQDIEEPELKFDDDFFRLKSIENRDCTAEKFKEKLGDYMSRSQDQDQFIACEKWTLEG